MAENIAAATSILPVVVAADLAATDTTVWAVPVGSSAKFNTGSLCNHTAGTVTVTLAVVPAGDVSAAKHRVIHARSLAAGETYALRDILGGAMMRAGDHFSGFASAANSVSINLTGTIQS